MKYIGFLIFIFPIMGWAQEQPKVISIKDYNPQQKYEEKVCVVDLYGELECKEPVKKKEEEKPKKTLESILPTDPLIPGKNQGFFSQVQISGIGSYRGIGLLMESRNGHWAYGGGLKFHMYSPPINSSASSKLEVMALGEVSYYVFPRWYAFSKKNKVFDLSVNAQLGYNYLTDNNEALNRKSEPVLGIGARVSYPLNDSLRLQMGVDVYQNFSLKSVGNGGFLGVGFEF